MLDDPDKAAVPMAPPPPPPPAAARAGGGAVTADALIAGKAGLKPVPPAVLYPVSAFYFKVVFGEDGLKDETSFQEVTGIGAEMETEEVREGGENRYVQRLPKGVKHPALVLKRGIGAESSPLVKWCRATLEGGLSTQLLTAPLTVYLMDAEATPIRAWLFADTFPIKWEVDPFNATKSEVAIEKITLSYSYSNRLI